MQRHLQDRQSHTPAQFKPDLPPPLRRREPQRRLLRIHDPRQRPQNARHGSGHADPASDEDFHLHVAEALAVVPPGHVVVRPEDGVQEALKVEQQEPCDEAGGADVAVGEVPEHWGEDEEGEQEGEGREEDGGGVGGG